MFSLDERFDRHARIGAFYDAEFFFLRAMLDGYADMMRARMFIARR